MVLNNYRTANSQNIKVNFILFLVVSVILFNFVASSYAQEDIKSRFFMEANELYKKAQALQAELLSPSIYQKAVKIYEELSKDFDKGRINEVKKQELIKWLDLSIKNSERAQIVFSHLLVARDDALQADAISYAKDIFEEAETIFIDASKTLEKGNEVKAKEKSINSEKKYREAELIAIKQSIIGNVKLRLKESIDKGVNKFAPISINRSQTLLEEAEKILNSDRGAKSEAREKAEMAGYEVLHANYLASIIEKLRKDDENWEKVLLKNEEYLVRMISLLGFEPKFDEGFEKPVAAAVNAIKDLKQEKQQLATEISNQDRKIEELEIQIANLNSDLNKSKEMEAGLKAKLLLENQRKEKFKKIESIFSKEQAKVFREADQVKIRLLGLKFQSGKAIINPTYFELLTKLQRAIRIFPDYHITIEGHTDNKGNDRMNQLLSLNRAKAVMTYLIANMGLNEDQISAIGYGESRPIASNETEDGRAQNRRIDVVLSPNK